MKKNLFAWASISEKGTVNGIPGNQTGSELKVSNYYNFGQTHCIRLKNISKRKKMAKIAKELAKDSRIGYGQSDRNTLYLQAMAADWNFEKLKKKMKKCNTDCSSFASVCLNLAYGTKVWDCGVFTGNMIEKAKADPKKFSVLKIRDAEKAFKKGDMVIKSYSHVIINV